MEHRLSTLPGKELPGYRNTDHQPRHPAIRVAALIISYIFHPLFVPVYIMAFLLGYQPILFSGYDPGAKVLLLVRFILLYTFFPLVTVLLAKGLGFLQSIYLKTQKDRIIPYIACGIYYFWMCYVVRNQPENPRETVLLTMAIFIASSAGLMANIYMKVSMHAMSMGVLVMFMAVLGVSQATNYTLYASVAVFIAGLVCTARLIISDHSNKEVYTGLFIGAASYLAAIWADGILP